ncbi:MAG: peptidoglycan-associated lipoprotein Pal [Endomicrobiaceae bacterium]|nr:peptidoglycan-associated lipoprotein Pal [Endomicrobiaceae bacterium]
MKNYFKIGLLFLIAMGLGISACAKKQTIAPEPEQVAVEEPQITVEDIKFTEEPSIRDANIEEKTALETVYFDLDSSSINGASMNILKDNEKYLNANPTVNIVVEGHCDERGTTEYNLALGQRRALKIKEYYVQLGIAPNRIATISYGEEMPAVKMSSEAAWAKNRRAETKILSNK